MNKPGIEEMYLKAYLFELKESYPNGPATYYKLLALAINRRTAESFIKMSPVYKVAMASTRTYGGTLELKLLPTVIEDQHRVLEFDRFESFDGITRIEVED